MVKPRILFCDLDRTLLTSDHRLLDVVVRAVEVARAEHTKFVIATARSPKGVRAFAARLGVSELVVCCNGAWVGNVVRNEPAWVDPLAPDLAAEIVEHCASIGLGAMWYSADGVSTFDASASIRREAAITGERLRVAPRAESIGEPCLKLLVVAPSEAAQGAFSQLVELHGSHASMSRSHVHLLEVVARGASKAAAASRLAEQSHISARTCAAIGDSENDLDLLRWVGTPLGVANSIPAIRKISRFCGRSCDEGGAADAIRFAMGDFAAPQKLEGLSTRPMGAE